MSFDGGWNGRAGRADQSADILSLVMRNTLQCLPLQYLVSPHLLFRRSLLPVDNLIESSFGMIMSAWVGQFCVMLGVCNWTSQAAAGRMHADRGVSLRFPRYIRSRPDKVCPSSL